MPQRAFRRKLVLAVGPPVLLLIALTGLLLWQISRLRAAGRHVAHTSDVLAQANLAQRLLIDRETGFRGFLLTGEQAFLEPLEEAQRQSAGVFESLSAAVPDNPKQSARVEALRRLAAEWQIYADDVLRVRAANGNYLNDVRAGRGKAIVDASRATFDQLIATEQSLLASRQEFEESILRRTIGAGVGSALAMGFVMALLARRQLSGLAHEYEAALSTQKASLDALTRSEAEVRTLNESLEARVKLRTNELSEANVFLNALLASLQEGIVACDASGQLTLFNRRTREFHGLPEKRDVPPEQWADYYDLFQADGQTRMARDEIPLFRALGGEVIRDVEMVIAPRNKPPLTLLASGQAINAPDGAKLGAVVAMRDVTAAKRAERELQQFMTRLQQSNRELQDFASVASHDLQEPLRKIQAFGERLKSRAADLDDEGRDYIDRMQNAAGRMATLITDLLTFSRVTTRALPFVPVDLNPLAQEVLSDLGPRMQESGGRVDIEPLPTIDADPTQMRQLLQNLIINALKFARDGVAPRVRVSGSCRADDHGEVCELLVQDNGIGFDEKYLDRIFNMFQRLHGRESYAGTGIGLAVCRKIAERHHGTITAKSRPGEGATFVVTLPVRQNTETTTNGTDA